MKRLLIGVALVVAPAIIAPVRAQAPPWPAPAPPQWAAANYPDLPAYRSAAPTPSDAYREGLINRYELERLEGPLPAALQGPSPNGRSGFGSSN